MKKWTIVTLAAMAAFGLACVLDVRESPMTFAADRLGVSGFSRLVGLLLLVASGVLLTVVVLSKNGGGESFKGRLDYRSGIALALSILYILGVSYLGFCVSTFLYLLVLPPLFDRFRFKDKWSPLRLAAYAAAVTLTFHFFFGVFKVYLPPTILF